MTKSHSNAGSALGVGLIMGGLGVIAGLLLAPRSGRETRTKLADKHSELKGRAKHAAEEFRSRSKDAIDTGKEKVNNVTAEAKQIASERTEDVKSLGSHASDVTQKSQADAKRLKHTAKQS